MSLVLEKKFSFKSVRRSPPSGPNNVKDITEAIKDEILPVSTARYRICHGGFSIDVPSKVAEEKLQCLHYWREGSAAPDPIVVFARPEQQSVDASVPTEVSGALDTRGGSYDSFVGNRGGGGREGFEGGFGGGFQRNGGRGYQGRHNGALALSGGHLCCETVDLAWNSTMHGSCSGGSAGGRGLVSPPTTG